jgi:hypothetical protein
LNSEKIWKIWKKGKLNSELIWKIWKISVLVIIKPKETSSPSSSSLPPPPPAAAAAAAIHTSEQRSKFSVVMSVTIFA